MNKALLIMTVDEILTNIYIMQKDTGLFTQQDVIAVNGLYDYLPIACHFAGTM